MPAYQEMVDKGWLMTAKRCTVASLGDAAMGLAIYGMTALSAGQIRWGLRSVWNQYAAVICQGIFIAILVEKWALAEGEWNYTENMPVVPIAQVGLWPFLQLALLTPLCIFVASRRELRVS